MNNIVCSWHYFTLFTRLGYNCIPFLFDYFWNLYETARKWEENCAFSNSVFDVTLKFTLWCKSITLLTS